MDNAGELRPVRNPIAFLEEVFGAIDPAYRDHSRLIYEMFRHGTAHVFKPHQLRNPSDSSTIEWVSYVGGRRDTIPYDERLLQVDHLQPLLLDPITKRYILPIAINVLYNDLLGAIDRFKYEIRTQYEADDPTLLQHYTRTIKALEEPDDTASSW
jgi:hypothetical protein